MLKQSRMMPLGTSAPPFSLPDTAGRMHALAEFTGSKALVVAFICNHCPYVKHMIGALAQFARDYQSRGLAVVAISANDVKSHPDDAPPKMAQFAAQHGFVFPYLYDESQAVALAYQAVCTPDLFLFDGALRLAYCGQFDASRPGNKLPVTGADLRAAADAVLAGQIVAGLQLPSVGCNIKWKPANQPSWG
jgi:peroxiredoxin